MGPNCDIRTHAVTRTDKTRTGAWWAIIRRRKTFRFKTIEVQGHGWLAHDRLIVRKADCSGGIGRPVLHGDGGETS